MKLPLFPQDKVNHYLYGTIIYMLSYLVLNYYFAMIPVVLIGAAKEIYDYKTKKGNPDMFDFVWTVLGGLMCLVIVLITLR